MKNLMVACCVLFVLTACNQPEKANNPKFDYKIIKRQFEPFTDWFKDKEIAMKKVDKIVYYSAKAACKKIGQGWAYTKIENNGTMDCQESAEGYRCRKKHVQIECRKIDER